MSTKVEASGETGEVGGEDDSELFDFLARAEAFLAARFRERRLGVEDDASVSTSSINFNAFKLAIASVNTV